MTDKVFNYLQNIITLGLLIFVMIGIVNIDLKLDGIIESQIMLDRRVTQSLNNYEMIVEAVSDSPASIYLKEE